MDALARDRTAAQLLRDAAGYEREAAFFEAHGFEHAACVARRYAAVSRQRAEAVADETEKGTEHGSHHEGE